MIHLSPRQREIVTLVGRDGASYRMVGETLDISTHTVRAHVRVICDRAGNTSSPRTTLARLYYTVVANGGHGQ